MKLEVAQSFICNVMLVVHLRSFKKPIDRNVVHINIISFKRHLCSGDVVAQQVHTADNGQNKLLRLPPPKKRQQEKIRFDQSVLCFSQVSPLPVNGS